MTVTQYYFFILISILYGCSSKLPNTNIIIRGEVKNIPVNKVYLTDAYNWQFLQDSANYINDTFSFQLNSKEFEPHPITICFFDSTGKRKVLAIENYLLSTDSSKYAETAFIPDKGITIISGTYIERATINSDKLKIEGSKQNDPFFKTQLNGFGWINTYGEAKRARIINHYKSLIHEYPFSYYFIKMLYNYRTEYTKAELMDMLSFFNGEIQHHSSYTKKFSDYFKEMPTPGKPLLDYALKDSLGRLHYIFHPSSKLNMIILWASWCGPCRREIPELKKIYSQFKNKNLNMVSVSIDDDQAKWRLALEKEQMAWKQLIIDSSQKDKIKSSFNFSAIPVIIFTDNRGIQIKRIIGNDPTNFNNYKEIIEKYSE